MGAQRVLQAAAVLASWWLGVAAAAPSSGGVPDTHERVAIIDLGPIDPAVRRQLAAAVTEAGLDAVLGDHVEDALAGESVDADALALAAAMADAQHRFGALDCARATEASTLAISIAAGRQAANLPVPELPRALAYVLLCADRASDVDAAMIAASRLRSVGGSPDVPLDIWSKYPDIDVIADREVVPLEITADVPNAAIWVDFKRVGTSPVRVTLPAAHHVIAAASEARRGWAAGTAIASQTQLAVPTRDHGGKWSDVAQRVAGWRGAPSAQELGWVLSRVRARVALVRRGDTIEAFGRIGLADPERIGGGRVSDVDRIVALVVDRTHAWNDRAPDPNRPLLVEAPNGRTREAPTRWWVYASIIGAVAAGAVVLYANDAGSDRQRVELHQP